MAATPVMRDLTGNTDSDERSALAALAAAIVAWE
jgi:hypothetical protein